MTRLAVFFYSEIPAEVGPVRSMRASDIGIVAPVDGTMVTSGAAASRSTGPGRRHRVLRRGRPGFSRDSDRSSPYNLMADLVALVDTTATDEARRRSTTSRGATRRTSRRARRPRPWPRTSRRPRHQLEVQRRRVRQPELLRRRGRRSSRPTPCWCCGSRSATPATPTPRATRSPRPSSRARARRWCSTTAGWSRHLEQGRAWTPDEAVDQGGQARVPAGHTWIELCRSTAATSPSPRSSGARPRSGPRGHPPRRRRARSAARSRVGQGLEARDHEADRGLHPPAAATRGRPGRDRLAG